MSFRRGLTLLHQRLFARGAMGAQASISDVHFFGFGTPDGRSMGHVGFHEATGKIFVSSRLHPEGMSEAVQACAEDHEPVVWRDHPDDLIAYIDSKWLSKVIRKRFKTPEHAWRLQAIVRMEDALRQARAGTTKGSFTGRGMRGKPAL